MNGPHDMGGMQCFGPVLPEQNEPLFHASWEGKALALTVAMGASGAWNIDQSRSTRESLPPATYLGSSYYEIWIRGLEQLMLSRDLVTQAELTSGPPPSRWHGYCKPTKCGPHWQQARLANAPWQVPPTLLLAPASWRVTCTQRGTPACPATCVAT